ncbi:hypothetical protein GGR52DRAFT_571059 [Hypoxylon sp. FL1284]|nr:hypothetical protein GGR52DRAFT_571059 [Hypoxylon sp. FL1284]
MSTPAATATPEGQAKPSASKPIVFGIYGLPGCGKTFLLKKLKDALGAEHFAFYEGSEVIGEVTPGGLRAFKRLEREEDRNRYRARAIEKVAEEAAASGMPAVISGHFLDWNEGQEKGAVMYILSDLRIYTHILYLDTDPWLIAQRRVGDQQRTRPTASAQHLEAWQNTEKRMLRELCYTHGMLFMPVRESPIVSMILTTLFRKFSKHTEDDNLSRVKFQLSDFFLVKKKQPDTILVIDGDGTLAAEDSGMLFWGIVVANPQQDTGTLFRSTGVANSSSPRPDATRQNPLKSLFESSPDYSYTTFL